MAGQLAPAPEPAPWAATLLAGCSTHGHACMCCARMVHVVMLDARAALQPCNVATSACMDSMVQMKRPYAQSAPASAIRGQLRGCLLQLSDVTLVLLCKQLACRACTKPIAQVHVTNLARLFAHLPCCQRCSTSLLALKAVFHLELPPGWGDAAATSAGSAGCSGCNAQHRLLVRCCTQLCGNSPDAADASQADVPTTQSRQPRPPRFPRPGAVQHLRHSAGEIGGQAQHQQAAVWGDESVQLVSSA